MGAAREEHQAGVGGLDPGVEIEHEHPGQMGLEVLAEPPPTLAVVWPGAQLVGVGHVVAAGGGPPPRRGRRSDTRWWRGTTAPGPADARCPSTATGDTEPDAAHEGRQAVAQDQATLPSSHRLRGEPDEREARDGPIGVASHHSPAGRVDAPRPPGVRAEPGPHRACRHPARPRSPRSSAGSLYRSPTECLPARSFGSFTRTRIPSRTGNSVLLPPVSPGQITSTCNAAASVTRTRFRPSEERRCGFER